MSRTFIVLGLARSGTSLAAGSLSILGVEMDTGVGPPDRFAPKGYYESPAAVAINKKIYRLAAGGAPDYADDDVEYYWHPPAYENVLRQADAIAADMRAFAKANAGRAMWGFKNPATCLTLDLYLPYFENPSFVVTHRDFEEIVAVCKYIYKLDVGYIRRVMATYKERLEDVLAAQQGLRIDIEYTEFKEDHRRVAQRLANFCGVELTPEHVARFDSFVVRDQFGIAKYRSRLARRKLEAKRALDRFLSRFSRGV